MNYRTKVLTMAEKIRKVFPTLDQLNKLLPTGFRVYLQVEESNTSMEGLLRDMTTILGTRFMSLYVPLDRFPN